MPHKAWLMTAVAYRCLKRGQSKLVAFTMTPVYTLFYTMVNYILTTETSGLSMSNELTWLAFSVNW